MTSGLNLFYCDSELSPFTKGFIRQVENLNHRRYDVGLKYISIYK